MSRWRGLVNFITCDPGWQSQWIIAREASANSSLTNTLQIFYNYTNTQEMLSQTWSEWYLKVERPQMQTQMQGENSINVKQYGRIKCILGGIYGKYKVGPQQIQCWTTANTRYEIQWLRRSFAYWASHGRKLLWWPCNNPPSTHLISNPVLRSLRPWAAHKYGCKYWQKYKYKYRNKYPKLCSWKSGG